MNRIQFVVTFVRREEAERFIEEVRGDDPDIASYPSFSSDVTFRWLAI